MEESTGSLAAQHTLSPPHTRASSRSPSVRRQQTEDSVLAGRVWAREPESDPWSPCILALDGGGIRGYSSLLILKNLMHEIWVWEQRLEEEDVVDTNGLDDAPAPIATSQDTLQSSTELPNRPIQTTDMGNNAEDTEQQYGVTTNLPSPDQMNSPNQSHATSNAVSHLQQDQLTAHLSKKKAFVEEELLPCHYFDFMYGTSTGGLIATVLGRLRMTVTEGLELYRKVGDDLFGKQRSRVPLTTKYHHEPLEKAVRDIVGSRCHDHPNCAGNDWHPWNADYLIANPDAEWDVDDPRVCHSCCLTATHDQNLTEAHLLRTYPHYYSKDLPNWIIRYNEGADMLPIWVVTRATTAAPFYFDMITAEVNGTKQYFQDGGIRENNPSDAAMSEFHALYAGKLRQPTLLLSVGTGRPDQSQDGFADQASGLLGRLPFVGKFLQKRAVLKNLVIKYTEGEKTHLRLREHAEGEHTWYKRLNVSEGLQNMPLDDWIKGDWLDQHKVRHNIPGGSSLTRMEDATTKYLERPFDPLIDSYERPGVMLEQAAEKLVRQRRERERLGGERWDTFIGRHLHQIQRSNHNAG